jgi:DNA-binding transcriptional ArsR family regulator
VNVGGARRPQAIELDVAVAYDFLLGPVIAHPQASEHDQYEATPTWLATVRARGGEEILAELEAQTGSRWAMSYELIALAVLVADGPKEPAAFLDHVEAMAADDLARLMLDRPCDGEEEHPGPELVAEAVGGDRAAAGRLLGMFHGDQRRRAAVWLADPEGVRADLLALLRRWQERVFAPEQARLRPILERDGAAKARVREAQGSEGMLRAIGGTLQVVFGPRIQRVVVAPSVLARPAIFWLEHEEAGLHLIIYPVADESLEEPEAIAPPRGLVRLYKALSDETRLKILRLVSAEELYATEIAERLGLSKATVSHHMVLLRAAGLVEVLGERKAERYYALHPPTLEEPTTLLRRYLGR